MRKIYGLLAGLAALAVMSLPAQAVIVGNFGINPTSAQGDFSNDPNGPLGGIFFDQYLFQLVGGPQFVTIASATNTFATGGITGPNGIQNFTGAVYQVVGAPDVLPGGDDILRFGPTAATLCGSGLCQFFDTTGILNAGSYYLALAGNAGLTAGYGGNLSVADVSQVPVPGAVWLFGSVLGIVGAVKAFVRRRERLAVA